MKMKLKKIVCPFLCLMLLCGCSHVSFKKKNNPNQEVGESIQEMGFRDHSVYSILYPKTGIDELDNMIKTIVNDGHKAFDEKTQAYKEKRKAEYNVSYESYLKDERYLSIRLDIYESIYDNHEEVKTLVYDSKESRFLSLKDICHGDYLHALSKQAQAYFKERFPKECDQKNFQLYTSPAEENFASFVLKKDRIVFYFAPKRLFDNAASMEIMYSDFKDYLDFSPETTSAYVPYDQVLNENVKPVDPNKPMVALTFDDGPSPKYTARILDALKENNASATFFVLGSNAQNAPDLLQRMVLEGNEIGNHTYSHKQLTTLSKEGIEEEIKETKECIYTITHTYPQVLRPPYGSKNDTVVKCADDARVVTWSLDTRDWKDRDAKIVVERILKDVKDGDIILMHDLYASSAQAAAIAIPKLQEMGFQLVTVSQLYETKGM